MLADTILSKIIDYEDISIENEYIDGDLDINRLTEEQIKENQRNYSKKTKKREYFDQSLFKRTIFIRNAEFKRCVFKNNLNLFYKEGYQIHITNYLILSESTFDNNAEGVSFG